MPGTFDPDRVAALRQWIRRNPQKMIRILEQNETQERLDALMNFALADPSDAEEREWLIDCIQDGLQIGLAKDSAQITTLRNRLDQLPVAES